MQQFNLKRCRANSIKNKIFDKGNKSIKYGNELTKEEGIAV